MGNNEYERNTMYSLGKYFEKDVYDYVHNIPNARNDYCINNPMRNYTCKRYKINITL